MSYEVGALDVEVNPLASEESVAVQAPFDDLVLNHRENGRKLARSLLRRWRVVMNAEEVDSIVDLTLCEAASRYCVDKGASFVTFFFYHLRGQLVRAVASAANDNALFLTLARSAGIDTTDWSSVTEENTRALAPDYTAMFQRETEGAETLLIRKESISLCKIARDKLDDLEKEILDRSYEKDEALVDIAKSLGYSRCHVSRVKKRALDRLRDFIADMNGAPIAVSSEEDSETEVLSVERSIPVARPSAVRVRRRRGIARDGRRAGRRAA